MPDALTRIVRTVAPYLWAWIALKLGMYLGVQFTPEQALAAEGILGTIIYSAIALFAKRYPWLERLLIFNKRIVYHDPA